MIVTEHPSKKKKAYQPPVVYNKPGAPFYPTTTLPPATMVLGPTGHHNAQRIVIDAAKKGISVKEWARRDNLVRGDYNKCPHKPGEIVEPGNSKDMIEYGECRIVGICKDYFDYGDDEWNDENRPFIITFEAVAPLNEKLKGKHFFGTVGYFKEQKEHNVC